MLENVDFSHLVKVTDPVIRVEMFQEIPSDLLQRTQDTQPPSLWDHFSPGITSHYHQRGRAWFGHVPRHDTCRLSRGSEALAGDGKLHILSILSPS